MTQIRITCFTDVLCVWAYVGLARVEAVMRAHQGEVAFENRFCSVFGDTARKIPATWGAADGYGAFNAHLRKSLEAFPEIALNPKVWLEARPASSLSPHLFLKSVQIAEAAGDCAPGAYDAATRAMRLAFFAEARDIADRAVQEAVARGAGVDLAAVARPLQDGRAHAALACDYQDAEKMGVQGSPTYVLNEGRQKLYGNVGYRIIEANIQELLREPSEGQASWC